MLILAFDPSMAHTGWALIGMNEVSGTVMRSGTISLGASMSNPEDYLDSFYAFASRIEKVILAATTYDMIVHEMPVSGVKRADSALLAAASIRYHSRSHSYKYDVCGVNPRHAKKLVTGNPNASKPMVLAWFSEHLPVWRAQLKNEHERDAAVVGIAWYIDKTGSKPEWMM